MVTGKRPYSRRARVSTFWRRNDWSLAINREAVTSPARAIPQTPDATPQEEPPRKGGAKPGDKSVVFVPPQIWRLASEIQGFASPDQRGHDNMGFFQQRYVKRHAIYDKPDIHNEIRLFAAPKTR